MTNIITPIPREHVRIAHEVFIGEINRLRESTPKIPRGGTYGTNAMISIMSALAEGGVAGYQAAADGFQTSDLSVVVAQYPNAVKIVNDYPLFRQEVAEMDTDDICTIAIQLLRIIQRLNAEFSAVQDVPRAVLTPEEAWNAAELSLIATGDIVKFGLRTFRNDFDIFKIPALLQAIPDVTRIATNAPLAVQGWKMLTLRQKSNLLIGAIGITTTIIESLDDTTYTLAP